MSFEHFDHRADIGIRGTGLTQAEAFENAGRALFAVMTDLEKVQPNKKIEIRIEATNKEELFYKWLSELIFLMNVENMLFSKFSVEIKNNSLTGHAHGEPIDFNRHSLNIEVKAITYSQLEVKKSDNLWTAQCIVDL
ncbi:MAG: archease [Promethearchaeota archaeon]